MMRRLRQAVLLTADVAFVGGGALLTLAGLGKFDVEALRDPSIGPALRYTAVSMVVAAIVFVVMGVHRSLWRYVSLPDVLRIVSAVTLVTLISAFLVFSLDRLDGVSRSVPLFQWLIAVAAMTSARTIARLTAGSGSAAQASAGANRHHVLIVGMNRVTELYMRTVTEFGHDNVVIAGILDDNRNLHNRMMRGHPILGASAAVGETIAQMRVHGIDIDRVIVASPLATLSPEGRAALADIERRGGIDVEFLAEHLGFDDRPPVAAVDPASDVLRIADASGLDARLGGYITLKRAMDIALALALIIFLAPLTLLVALVVALDVGFPLIFWQQRPGHLGRPFRVYKFRTMGAAHDVDGNRLPDAARNSLVGRFLRRVRLDEIPQLFNILAGEMSFIGPRPLLPIDQPAQRELRLVVRPGITGWAQVNGGRDLTPDEKNALDIWYIRHASLLLDINILLRTLRTAVFGERTNARAVAEAVREAAFVMPPPASSDMAGHAAAVAVAGR
ncbi:MAG: sugar transferase [Hyphomicrobiaceae bacterium]